MRFSALALDYDGTLASQGVVSQSTVSALRRVRASRRKLVLVSGRHFEEMLRIFPEHDLFDSLVLENGPLLYFPSSGELRLISDPVPPALPAALRKAGVTDFAAGRGVLATWRPHEHVVREVLHALDLDWEVVFNKDALMVLPPGMDKASGLSAALDELRIASGDVIAVGDAENDIPMLRLCGYGVAVGNALASVKAESDLVMEAERGKGVEQVIRELLRDGLQGCPTRTSATAKT